MSPRGLKWSQNRYNTIKRHYRNASERESSLFLRNIGSPIKAFGDDEALPVLGHCERSEAISLICTMANNQ